MSLADLALLDDDHALEAVHQTDVVTAAYLRERGYPHLATEIENGDHWTWHAALTERHFLDLLNGPQGAPAPALRLLPGGKDDDEGDA